jgi:hypothetical protein
MALFVGTQSHGTCSVKSKIAGPTCPVTRALPRSYRARQIRFSQFLPFAHIAAVALRDTSQAMTTDQCSGIATID